MTTKSYLRQISRLDRMITNKMVEISRLREMAQSISAIKTEEKVQSSGDPDTIGKSIAKIDEMERQVDSMVDDLVEKKKLIMAQIDDMDDEMHYEVLFSYYVEGLTFEKIAAKIDYSFRQILRLHGQALVAFEKKYGHTYQKK